MHFEPTANVVRVDRWMAFLPLLIYSNPVLEEEVVQCRLRAVHVWTSGDGSTEGEFRTMLTGVSVQEVVDLLLDVTNVEGIFGGHDERGFGGS